MPPEVHLEEELAELREWGHQSLVSFLERYPKFIERFIDGKLQTQHVARFWAHMD